MFGWKLSKHAKERKNERRISDDDIKSCLKKLNENTRVLNDTCILHYNTIMIIVNIRTNVIITVIDKGRFKINKSIINGKKIVLKKNNEYIHQLLWDKEKSKMKNNKKIAKAKRVNMNIDIYNDYDY
jgi:hypothetical protein